MDKEIQEKIAIEPPLLSDEEIVASWGAHPTTGDVGIYRRIAQAQREIDIEFYRGEL